MCRSLYLNELICRWPSNKRFIGGNINVEFLLASYRAFRLTSTNLLLSLTFQNSPITPYALLAFIISISGPFIHLYEQINKTFKLNLIPMLSGLNLWQ